MVRILGYRLSDYLWHSMLVILIVTLDYEYSDVDYNLVLTLSNKYLNTRLVQSVFKLSICVLKWNAPEIEWHSET
jgi:hypothetical protein